MEELEALIKEPDSVSFLSASEPIYSLFLQLLESENVRLHKKEDSDGASARFSELVREYSARCLQILASAEAKEDEYEQSFSGIIHVLRVYTHSLPEDFPMPLYGDIITACLNSSLATSLLVQAMQRYGDLFLYGMKCLKHFLESSSISHQQAFSVLSVADVVRGNNDVPVFCHKCGKGWKKRAAAFSTAWMTFLGTLGDGNNDVLLKKVLRILDDRVIPFLSSPTLLIDFLTLQFGKGGIVGWLSIASIFTLIRKYRLDYPHFFDRLLPMLTPEIMHSRYRKRFLSLFGTFMKSTHITKTQLQAFLKRIAQLSISAPPSAAHWIIPFCYNMVKQHDEELHGMVHCTGGSNTNALYELDVLFHHHIGRLARQAGTLKDRMHRPLFDLDKYLRDGDRMGIPTMLAEELEHKWSRPPPLAQTLSPKLF